MKNLPSPPLWIQRFFRWYCNQSHQEHLEGDLFELFERRVNTHGLRRAKWYYFRDVIDLVRPFTLRRNISPYYPFIYPDMFFHQLKTVLRNMRRNASFTLINVLGLTLSLIATLVIFLKVGHDLNFDRSMPAAGYIFRVLADGSDHYHAGIPEPVYEVIRTNFPQIEAMAVIDRNFEVPVLTITDENGQKKQFKEEQVAMVWPEYLKIFTYEWIAGNPLTALENPHSAVIARSMAERMYGTSDVVGKTFSLNQETEMLITGVYNDPPLSTNFPFLLLMSKSGDLVPPWLKGQWNSFAETFQLYVKINPHADIDSLNAHLAGILKTAAPKEENILYTLRLQPLKDIHLDTRHYAIGKPAISRTTLGALVLIAVFLLISACINFINLNTSLIFQRAKEVGLRKVLGSQNGNIFRFFMLETGVLVIISFFIAIALTPLVLRQAEFILGEKLPISLVGQLGLWPWILAFFVLVCLLAGLYPAFLLSRINPVIALKNKVEKSYGKGMSLRKGLMVMQFSISQMLIICMLVAMQQMQFFHNAPMGFDHTALIEVKTPANDFQKLKQIKEAFLQDPSIRSVCFSNNGAAADGYWQYDFAYLPQDSQKTEIKGNTHIKIVDNDYISTYGIELVAGAPFAEWDTLSYTIINETLLKMIGLNDGNEALGQIITIGGQKYQIQGVVKDFHLQSLHSEIAPAVLICDIHNTYTCGIKIKGQNLNKTLAHISFTWEETFPGNVFEYRFLDDIIASFYENEKRVMELFQLAAIIAICIGALGLFGLISLIAAQRNKEIGIRKVLGASVGNILAIFSADFGWLVLLGFVIAAPFATWAMLSWLENFAYRIPLQLGVFVLALLASGLIMLLSIGWKTFRVASMNPVDAIRDE
ncbi:MAG: ABC transporter permease [Bacteroidia bacterium]